VAAKRGHFLIADIKSGYQHRPPQLTISPLVRLAYLQASAFGMLDGGKASDPPSWNAEETSERIEDDATTNLLFDQYLHQNLVSTTDPPEAPIEETSQKVPNDLENKDLGVATRAVTKALDHAFLKDADQKKE
jgi:hypothetical protein